MLFYYIFIVELQKASFQYPKSCFKYALELPRKCRPLGIREYDLVPFNVVDNENQTILLMNDYKITSVKFVSLDDYRQSQCSNCHSISDEQIKGITITLISCFY